MVAEMPFERITYTTLLFTGRQKKNVVSINGFILSNITKAAE